MPNKTKRVVPIEVITTTVQRSVRYIDTDDVNLALAAVRHDVVDRPERYDSDEVIVYRADVRLPDGMPLIAEIEDNRRTECAAYDIADLIAPYTDPTDIMPPGWRQSRTR